MTKIDWATPPRKLRLVIDSTTDSTTKKVRGIFDAKPFCFQDIEAEASLLEKLSSGKNFGINSNGTSLHYTVGPDRLSFRKEGTIKRMTYLLD